jgi:hypothetical protein
MKTVSNIFKLACFCRSLTADVVIIDHDLEDYEKGSLEGVDIYSSIPYVKCTRCHTRLNPITKQNANTQG